LFLLKRGIALEELYHEQFTFQLQMVHLSAANGSLFSFKWQTARAGLTVEGSKGIIIVAAGMTGFDVGG
jgi:hypothetical protein